MRHLQPRLVLVSAFRSNQSTTVNRIDQDSLIRQARHRDMRYVIVNGVYQGVNEETLAIVVDSPWTIGIVFDWAKNLYNQDCILLREPDGSCYILSNSSSQGDYIGQWTEISSTKADTLAAYTEYNDRFFAAI